MAKAEERATHESTEAEARLARAAARGRAPRGQRARRRAPPLGGQAARARARRAPLRSRLVRRARPLRPPPRVELRDARAAPVRRRGRHRLRDDLRPQGLRLLAGLHRLRRLAERGVRREDLQGHGSRREARLSRDRHQRLGRRAHPGRRRLARGLRGDLLAQRAVLGRDPADLARHGPVRGRRRLLARDDRLRLHGRGLVVHVHHRARRGEDGDRRGGHVRGARRRRDARLAQRRRALRRARRGRRASTTRATSSRSCRRTTSTRRRTPSRRIRATARARSSTRSSPTTRTSRTT